MSIDKSFNNRDGTFDEKELTDGCVLKLQRWVNPSSKEIRYQVVLEDNSLKMTYPAEFGGCLEEEKAREIYDSVSSIEDLIKIIRCGD